MRTVLFVTLAVISLPTFAEGWLCIADSAAGFRHNKQTQTWDAATFSTDYKFVIKRQSADSLFKKSAWVFQEVGQKHEAGACKEDFDDHGYLKCWSLLGQLTFRKETLRFIISSDSDYFLSDRERDDIRKTLGRQTDARDDMGLQIGRCTTL